MSPPYFPTLVVGGNPVAFEHLEPRRLLVPTQARPAGIVIDVVFSNHCFSETFDPQVHFEPIVDVWDRNRRRVFDQTRYQSSAALPAIVDGLPTSPVFLTPEANFVRVVAPTNGGGGDYRMFFRLERAKGHPEVDLKMHVESAYSPNPGQALATRDMTRVRFVLLVDKTLSGQKISRHQKR